MFVLPPLRPLPIAPPTAKPAPVQLNLLTATPPSRWTLEGTAAGETLNGTANNDRIYGAGGNDTINGLAGNDIVNGGAGANRLTGGAGADLFVFDKATATAGQVNVITDFKTAEHDHLAFVGFGRLPLTTTQPTATSNGGIWQHVVKVAGVDTLQLDVYLSHTATPAATVQLVGISATQTAQALFGGPILPLPFLHHH